jgi:hypothetical protein
MIIRYLFGVPSICAMTFLCMLSSAHAQTSPSRVEGPFAGLFGGASPATHSLDFRGSLFGVYQKVSLPPELEQNSTLDPRFTSSGTFAGTSGSLNYIYGRRGNHAFFDVDGHGSIAEYSVLPDVPQYTVAVSAATGLFGQLTQKIRYSTSATATYSPYYGYAPFSQAVVGSVDSTYLPPQFGFSSRNSSNVALNTNAQLTDQLTRRSSISAVAGWVRFFVFDDTSRGTQTFSGRVNYNYRVVRNLTVYVGYQLSETHYSDSGDIGVSQGIDAGFNYGEGLTFRLGRHTTATFYGGVTGARAIDSPTHYAVTGRADIVHTLGRTWSSSAGYHRSFGFIDLFSQPVLSDSLTGTIAGLVAPRLNSSSSVGWTRGRVGFGGPDNNLGASFASSTLTLGVSRRFGLYTQYVYYRYEVPVGDFTRFDIPSNLSRHAASIGLTLWVPIFNNARSRRDSR